MNNLIKKYQISEKDQEELMIQLGKKIWDVYLPDLKELKKQKEIIALWKKQQEIIAFWKKQKEITAEVIARINNGKPLTNWLQKKKKR